MKKEEKEFKERIETPAEVEKQKTKTDDDVKIKELIEGEQSVYIKGYGDIVFVYPNAGLVIQAEQEEAEFKATQLRQGKLLTEEQLKAIYGVPVVVTIDGKEIVVGSGEWNEEDERLMEELPEEIRQLDEQFELQRDDYQDVEKEILKSTKKTKAKLIQKKNTSYNQARSLYIEMLEKQEKLLKIQTKRLKLFSSSLEERAFFVKIKTYLPSCVKIERDGKREFLWKSYEEFENDSFLASRVISLFNLFIRGVDISFFGDQPDEVT